MQSHIPVMKSNLPGLHRKPGVDRETHDFYATHPSAVQPLLKVLGWENGGKVIRENSCGQGHLCKPLEKAGHTVIATDLIDRGYGITGIDFLKHSWFDELKYDAVIMNPPYKYAQQFIEKSLKIAPITCAFLRLVYLESQQRRYFFDKFPPKFVCVFSKRMPSAKSGDFDSIGNGGTVAYAWFIWESGFSGSPEIKWI